MEPQQAAAKTKESEPLSHKDQVLKALRDRMLAGEKILGLELVEQEPQRMTSKLRHTSYAVSMSSTKRFPGKSLKIVAVRKRSKNS
jgi:hypothetical protein